MKQKRSYHEATLPFNGEPLPTVARIVRLIAPDDYVVYEHEGEWSMGAGVHASVIVYPKQVVVKQDGHEHVLPINEGTDLSITIHSALSDLPVNGWRVYGVGQFELARFLYNLSVPLTTPLVSLFIPKEEVRVCEGSIFLRALERDRLRSLIDDLEAVMNDASCESAGSSSPLVLGDVIATHGGDGYKKAVQTALEEIWLQKYRKVILSRKVPLADPLDMVASYVAGRQANTPARSYLLRLDGLEAAGFSPETVAEVTDDRQVFTTPLAGTRSTGEDLTQELVLREELLSDSKELAEHAISVYTAFSELTAACESTSVQVINFMLVSRRGTVQHLASRLQGKLLPQCNPWHAFNALFPAVTASGIPKRESIEAIGRIEPEPRGPYAGCVLICDQRGVLDAALILRSFYQRDGQAWVQAGAGIMNMSIPERELEETREKLGCVAEHLVGSS